MLDVEKERGHVFWAEPPYMRQEGQKLFYRHGVPDTYLSDLAEEMLRTRSRAHPAQNPQTFSDGQTLELASGGVDTGAC